MGGIKPPRDYHIQLNRRFAKKVLLVNIIMVLIAIIALAKLTVITWQN